MASSDLLSPELNSGDFPSGRDTIGIRTSGRATGRLQREAGAMPRGEGRHIAVTTAMHVEAKLKAHKDVLAKKQLVEDVMEGRYTKAMARAGPGKSMVCQEAGTERTAVARILTKLVDESYTLHLGLIKTRELQKERNQQREIEDRAQAQERAREDSATGR